MNFIFTSAQETKYLPCHAFLKKYFTASRFVSFLAREHCEKNNSTIPNLGKVFPILGREILHKSSLNQSNLILEAAVSK